MLRVVGLSNESVAKTAISKSVSRASNKSFSVEQRIEALNFMALRDADSHETFLKSFLNPREQLFIQLAALRTLITIKDNSICNYLIDQWPTLTPELRDVAISAFLVNPERVTLLLDAIKSGKVEPASLGWTRSAQLMSNSDQKIRNRARSLLANSDEEKVNKDYQQALQLEGNQTNGKVVFMQNCGKCHQIRGKMGNAFGPDLGTIHNWLPKNIMANVLSPNLSISGGFDLWAVELKNGESVQGIIASETSAAITLRPSPGVEKTINRQDIVSLKSVNVSAMPSGLEKEINQQQMADLLAFFKKTK
jgi:putative heme-binding domain-containing protein